MTFKGHNIKSKAQAASLTLLAVFIVAVAVYVSVEFSVQVRRVNWSIVTGVCGGAFMIHMFYQLAVDPSNTVDPLDMILDPVTRRVSLWRMMIVIMFALGVWIIVQWVISGKVPDGAGQITALYGTMLGSIVAKVASGEWADVKANRNPVPADAPSTGDGTTQ